MQFYPSYLPPPQQRGFNYKIKPNIIRTQMADGHVRQRLVNTGLNEYGSTESLCRIQNGELSASLNCVNSDGPLWSVQCRLDVEPGIGGDEVWIDPEGWDELYAYIWVAYYTNYEWPGIKLKKNKLGYYVFKLDLLRGYPNDGYVEFNDNNGNTTWSFYSYKIDDWAGRIIKVKPDSSEVEYISWFS